MNRPYETVVEAGILRSPPRLADALRKRCFASIFLSVSPTVYREGSYRFFFFSREEARLHVHVVAPDGEAKFWLDPIVALSNYTGFDSKQLRQIQTIVEEHQDDFRESWHQHFGT